VAVAAWWFRGRISEATVAGLREQINGLREQINVYEARLHLAAEKLILPSKKQNQPRTKLKGNFRHTRQK
jgi:hypothetical protein